MQQIAFVDTATGERGERRLLQRDGEAERFYRELKQREVEVRVGMEATGMPAGSNDCWPSSVSSCGLGTQRGSEPGECANRRPTGESRSAPTVVAPTSPGTNANAEPTASRGPERRATTQADAVE